MTDVQEVLRDVGVDPRRAGPLPESPAVEALTARPRMAAKDHPARYSKTILEALEWLLADIHGTVLDPFGGVGLIHTLARPDLRTVSVELQPRFVNAVGAHPERAIVGNSLHLPFRPNSIDAAATSVAYGNRMADTYMGGNDKCVPCKKAIKAGELEVPDPDCERCSGSGLAPSKRMTYTIANGGPLYADNSGAMQWDPGKRGDSYRALHRGVWRTLAETLKPGAPFILNVSNHIRNGAVMPVVEWHVSTLLDIGFGLVKAAPVKTPRYGLGANSKVRAETEMLVVVSAPEAPTPERLFD